MENITLGFAMCGSFCTFDPVLTALEALKAQYPDIIPILSPASIVEEEVCEWHEVVSPR